MEGLELRILHNLHDKKAIVLREEQHSVTQDHTHNVVERVGMPCVNQSLLDHWTPLFDVLDQKLKPREVVPIVGMTVHVTHGVNCPPRQL